MDSSAATSVRWTRGTYQSRGWGCALPVPAGGWVGGLAPQLGQQFVAHLLRPGTRGEVVDHLQPAAGANEDFVQVAGGVGLAHVTDALDHARGKGVAAEFEQHGWASDGSAEADGV